MTHYCSLEAREIVDIWMLFVSTIKVKTNSRSSCSQIFFKIGIIKNFANWFAVTFAKFLRAAPLKRAPSVAASVLHFHRCHNLIILKK